MKKFFFGLMLCGFLISCGDDDADPVLTITSGTAVDVLVTDTEDGVTTIAGTATDDVGIANVTLSSDNFMDDTVIAGSDLVATTGAFSLDLTIPAGTVASTFEIKAVATDTEGNTDEETVTVTITN